MGKLSSAHRTKSPKRLTMRTIPQDVPALVKAFRILEFLRVNGKASFTEIYSQLLIPKSTAHQLLASLKSYGYVRQTAENSKYSLGFRLFELGMQTVSHLDIRAEALPFLQELMRKTKQTSHLGVLDDIDGVYLAKVESTQPIRVYSWEGKRLPLHSTAMGKVLLAWQDEEKLEDLFERIKLARFTEKTITNVQDLRKHLRLVKNQGWALDDQENEPNIRCIGAPVRSVKGEVVAAVSISGLASVIDGEQMVELRDEVIEITQQLSVQLGFK